MSPRTPGPPPVRGAPERPRTLLTFARADYPRGSATALDEAACLELIEQVGHGVLATVHRTRGVDAVPVVFAIDGGLVIVPVDTLKPKRSTELQRVRNIEEDPRCVLLVENYSDDWDELWWVRVHARASIITSADRPRSEELEGARSLLARRHPRYGEEGSIVAVIMLAPEIVTSWEAVPFS